MVVANLVTSYLPSGEVNDVLFGLAIAFVPIAAGIAILRDRLYDIDRRFNRRRYDAARTVEAFATRLREQVDLDALNAELLAAVHQTMEPTTAWLWLPPPQERFRRHTMVT